MAGEASDKIRLGVIGCGYWGPNLIRNFVAMPSATVVGVSDLQQERLKHIKSLYPHIEVTQNYHDLFSMDLDAAVVVTPPATHYSIGKECLEHNLHTLIEKPMTISSEHAQELVDLAAQRNLTLMAGHTFEYNPAVRMVKEIIESGDLGKILYIDAVRVNLGLFQSDLNVLWDLAPHDVSILMYLLGMPPAKVSARGGTCIFEGKHDIAYLYLEFPDGVLAHVHVSWLDPCKVRRITIVGSKKMLVYDDIEPLEKIKIYDKGVETLPYTDTFGDFHCSYRYGDVVIPYIRFTEPLRIECEYFLSCIANGIREPQSNGEIGLQVVQVLEAGDRSLHNGGLAERLQVRLPSGMQEVGGRF
jgi:predicted dehydrogenase